MPSLKVKFLPVKSKTYGEYTIIHLEGITVKELNGRTELADAFQNNFGDRFVIIRQNPGGERDYILNEHIIGIPTPEFERQVEAGDWQEKEIETE